MALRAAAPDIEQDIRGQVASRQQDVRQIVAVEVINGDLGDVGDGQGIGDASRRAPFRKTPVPRLVNPRSRPPGSARAARASQ